MVTVQLKTLVGTLLFKVSLDVCISEREFLSLEFGCDIIKNVSLNFLESGRKTADWNMGAILYHIRP